MVISVYQQNEIAVEELKRLLDLKSQEIDEKEAEILVLKNANRELLDRNHKMGLDVAKIRQYVDEKRVIHVPTVLMLLEAVTHE